MNKEYMVEIPDEIVKILETKRDKKKISDDDKLKLRTFLGILQTGQMNPAEPSKQLCNPNPIEVDVSLKAPKTLEQRVRHIMSVSSRIAEQSRMESAEEADDFDVSDNFDVMPGSPFEMKDHFMPMEPETPPEPLAEPATPPAEPASETPSPDEDMG